MIGETITGKVLNGVIQRMMDDAPLTAKQAEWRVKRMVRHISGPAPVEPEKITKRYRSPSHRPDAACIAKTQAEAREFFRQLMGVEKLPQNFKLERF